MNRRGAALAGAAESLIGTPFRLHGRDPACGLDCVGLVAQVMKTSGLRAVIPAGYGLRNSDIAAMLEGVSASGLVETTGEVEPGDILLVKTGPAQFHLLIASGRSRFIHAHAGLRRVVATPGPLAWPILHHWRATCTN